MRTPLSLFFLLVALSARAQIMTTIAGTGVMGLGGDGIPATTAKLDHPYSVAKDAAGNIYIADAANQRIRKIDVSGVVTTFAGTGSPGSGGDGGPATAAQLHGPICIVFDAGSNMFIADQNNNKIRKISPAGIITTFAGSGTATYGGDGGPANLGQLNYPTGVGVDAAGNVYIADQYNHRVRKVGLSGIITTIAGNGLPGFAGDGSAATLARIKNPCGVAADGAGNIYFTDYSNSRIRKVNPAGIISTIAGSTPGFAGDMGPAVAALLSTPFGIAIDAGNNIYISDIYNHRIRKINSAGIINTIAGVGTSGYSGDGSTATAAQLNMPSQLYADCRGAVYFADQFNHAARLISGISEISGDSTLCAGTTLTLTDATTGGTWSSSSTTVATVSTGGIVSGVSAGTSIIRYTITYTCGTDYAFKTITVTPFPSAGTITGPSVICVGTTVSMTDAVAGGTWSSSNTSNATVSPGGLLTGVSVGTSIISYSLSTSCGLHSAIQTVTVSLMARTITGSPNLCVGSSISLTDAVAGGVWSSSNTAVAGVGTGSGVVAGIGIGTSTITYSVGAGCIATKAVTVGLLPGIMGPSNICTGKTITLSNRVAGGVWSSGATAIATAGTSSGIVTGISTGTATITYLLPSGCFSTMIITVNAVPPAITGTASVCLGQTTILGNSTIGGLWNSSNIAKATIGATTGIVIGISTGSATITYSLGSGCAATRVVTVYALPAPIVGASKVCVGSTIVLSDAVVGGTWSPVIGGIATAGLSTGVVSGVSAGTEIITYTLSTGCIMTKIVTVDPTPASITGTTHVCAGTTTSLTSTTSGGTWSSTGGTAIVGVITGVVAGSSAGTAVVTYTAGSGCITTTIMTISGTPMPITGPTSVCEGATIALSNLTTGGTWMSGNPGIATIDIATAIVSGVSPGITNITYTTGAGCFTARTVIVNPVSGVTGITTICAGATATLSDAVTGGTWSSSNSGIATIGVSSGNVSGVSVGAITMTYRLPTGCIATVPFTVNPLPFGGTITGAWNVCVSSSIVLSNPVAGGTWSSSDVTVSMTPYSNLVTGVSTGTATISYSYTNSCGTAIATHAVTVSTSPLAGTITGPTNVCVGASITLTDAITGGVWSSADVTVGVGAGSGIVSGVSKGTATITYTYTNTCGSAFAVYALTVQPLPVAGVIKGASGVCVSATTALTDSIAGGIWISSNGHATVVAGVVTGVSAGKDTIIYTTSNMCGTAATLHYMTIHPLPDAGSILGTVTVCQGVSTTLLNTAPGGVWSSPDITAGVGSATGIVTGISAGTATVSYQVANVCGTDVAVHSMTINPQPYAGAITGANSVCEGSAIALTDSISGGVWSARGSATSVSDGSVTGMKTGTDTILYSVTNMCGTDVAIHPIIVNPQPDAGTIYGPGDVCVGSSVTLTNASSGGVWSSQEETISIDSTTGIAMGIAGGNATIIYTVTNMCGVATATKIINVVAVPAVGEITGPSNVCSGGSIALSDISTGGIWETKKGMASVTGGIVTGQAAGTDTIVYSVSNMCGTSTAVKDITINPLPDAGVVKGSNNSVCPGDSVVLFNNGMAGVWGNSNNSLARMTVHADGSATITCERPGIDTVSYSVANSCGVAQAIYPVTIKSTPDCDGKNNAGNPFDCAGNGELVISPNPTGGMFTINVSSDLQEDVTIVIVNMLGQKLKTIATVTNAPFGLNLNQPAGVYIVSVFSSHGRCSKKVVVK